MTLDTRSLRLFGLDLTALPAYLLEGWAEALQWPALRWLTPAEPVRVLEADGTDTCRLGVSSRRIAAPRKVRFAAVALPEDILLRRSLALPPLNDDDVRQAVELDVRSASPFAEDDTAWGYAVRHGEPLRVDIAITSRRLIERQLEAAGPRLAGIRPEVWADGDPPVVIGGYGEAARLARSRRLRWLLFVLLAVAAVLVGALAVTPTLQLRAQAMEAVRKQQELARAVSTQVQMRDELAKVGDQVRLLAKASEARQDVVALIDEITRRVPDDTVLNRLEIAGNTVRLAGQADNAAQLLQTLGAVPAFREVRAPGGIARAPAGGKEGFAIEFRVDGEGKGS
jgi:general secretion pathway protein L